MMGQIGHRKSPRWKLAPTRHEQEKWDRAYKAATGGSVSSLTPLVYHLRFHLKCPAFPIVLGN